MKKINFNNAFTLLEMLAVLFIVGIILAIAVPTFGPMTGTAKLKTSAENLANAMRMAQQFAAANNKECYMVFPVAITNIDLNEKSYKIVYDNDPGAGITYRTVGKLDILSRGIQIDSTNSVFSASGSLSVPFPEDTDTSHDLRYITFKPNGAADKDGHIRLKNMQTNVYQEVYFYSTPRDFEIKDLVKP